MDTGKRNFLKTMTSSSSCPHVAVFKKGAFSSDKCGREAKVFVCSIVHVQNSQIVSCIYVTFSSAFHVKISIYSCSSFVKMSCNFNCHPTTNKDP